MTHEDPFCVWCRRSEERLWRAFVLAATAIALAGAGALAVRHWYDTVFPDPPSLRVSAPPPVLTHR